jgi:integrase
MADGSTHMAPARTPQRALTRSLATVAKVHDEFLDFKEANNSEGTYTWYRDKLKPFFKRFAHLPVASLTLNDGFAYKKWLVSEKPWKKGKADRVGVGDTTVNQYIRAAKTLLGWASESSRRSEYGVQRNEWEEIRYEPEKPRERILTDEEFRDLLDHCTDGNVTGGARDFREILVTLRYTTMRPGELRKLRWDYIHWDHGLIVFPAKVIKIRRRREVTMIRAVQVVLQARKARCEQGGQQVGGYVFPAAGKDRNGKRAAVNSERPITQPALSQRFGRLVQRCIDGGLIRAEKNGERIVPYTTRHTRITEMFVLGHDHATVMHDAGHLNPNTTERYKHFAGPDVAKKINSLDRIEPIDF